MRSNFLAHKLINTVFTQSQEKMVTAQSLCQLYTRTNKGGVRTEAFLCCFPYCSTCLSESLPAPPKHHGVLNVLENFHKFCQPGKSRVDRFCQQSYQVYAKNAKYHHTCKQRIV